MVLNPGLPAPEAYFDYADTIVEFEQSYATYVLTDFIAKFTHGFNDQAAIIIHTTPWTANLTVLIKPMIQAGVAQVYVTSDDAYHALDSLGDLSTPIESAGANACA